MDNPAILPSKSAISWLDVVNQFDPSQAYTHLSSPYSNHLTGSTSDSVQHDNVFISRTATVENQCSLMTGTSAEWAIGCI